MKLLFIDYPFSEKEHFIYGLAEDKSVDEFKKLFQIISFEKNICCQFPDSAALTKILSNVQSQELQNVLTKFVDKKVLIIPEKEDYVLPDNIYHIKI